MSMNQSFFISLTFSCMPVLYASECASQPYAFSEVDTDLFVDFAEKKVCSPYSTASVNSMPQNLVSIERKDFEGLYKNAFDRSKDRAKQEEDIIMMSCDHSWMATQEENQAYYKQRFAVLQQATKAHKDIVIIGYNQKENRGYIQKLPARDLMLLLQWSYGIQKAGSRIKIMLSASDNKMLEASLLLFSFIQKNHLHEKNEKMPKKYKLR